MKLSKKPDRRAVAPILATLLLMAAAVAMSVTIFMWSQGFLSPTSASTGSQQGAQNQAAQSRIAIESTTFRASPSSSSNCFAAGAAACEIKIVVLNVGSASIDLGSVSITGTSFNSGFTGSIMFNSAANNCTLTCTNTNDPSTIVVASTGTGWRITSSVIPKGISKGSAVTLTFNTSASDATDTVVHSGDVITIKVTTSSRTFAQATYIVP